MRQKPGRWKTWNLLRRGTRDLAGQLARVGAYCSGSRHRHGRPARARPRPRRRGHHRRQHVVRRWPGLRRGWRRRGDRGGPAGPEQGRGNRHSRQLPAPLPAGRAHLRVPWTILAGIGEVESNDGRSTLPGVHSGANAFGAAGPMQIGIGGAAGDTWGGSPIHPAGEHVGGVATDGNGDGIASVYEPADAIGGAAKYLLEHGVLTSPTRRHLRLQPPHLLCAGGAALGRGVLIRWLHGDRGPTRAAGVLPAGHHRHHGAEPDRGRRDRLRAAADRQALPVGRDRAGRVRLLRADDDGLPLGGHRHPAHLGAAVAVGPASPAGPRGTWRPGVLRRFRRHRPPRRATSAWSSGTT